MLPTKNCFLPNILIKPQITMSFSKSKVTRFNEITGCAPGVGSYDVKDNRKVQGAAAVSMNDKSQRFREDSCSSLEDSGMSKSSSMGDMRTPNKQNMPKIKGMDRRRHGSSVSSTPRHQAENGKIKQLEAKIKHLLLQETEMGRRLQQAHEKVDNLEATNSTHNSRSKELEDVKLQLRKKEKELEQVKSELNNKVHSLQADLDASQSNIKALHEARKALEQTNQQMRDHGEVIEEEIRQLQEVTDCLRQENIRLQDNLSSAIIQQESTECMIQRVKCSLLETESRLDASTASVASLQHTNSEMGDNLIQAESSITCLQEAELRLKDQISRLESKLLESQAQFEEETKRRKDAQEKLENLEEELERTETSTTESLRQMSDKYQTLEAILAQAEADLTWEVDTHKAQLASAEAISQQRAAECEILQIQNRDLIYAFNVEKKECDLLREQLQELTTEEEKELELISDRLDKQEHNGEEMKEICSDLSECLEDMKQGKNHAEDQVQLLQLNAQKEQQTSEEEKKQLSTALQAEKERVKALEIQLTELGNDFEELSNFENRLAKQEGAAEDMKMDKERLSCMLKLATERQESAEYALDQARTDQKAVQMSLEEQQQISASLESSLKITQRAKDSLMTQVELLQAAKKKLSADLLASQQCVSRLECEATSAKLESVTLREQVTDLEISWKSNVQDLEEASSHQRAEFGRRLVETQTKLSQSEAELNRSKEDHEAKTSQMRERLEERIEGLEERLTVLQAETDWKLKFEELMEKVAPFQDQLDQFEVEKRMLLSQSNAAQSEVDKLSTNYARLLGHHNQKQKIHHIMKIKDENASLKKEVAKLREENTKQSRNLRQMKDKVEKMDGKKKFDASTAFRHGKENQMQPLSQRN